MIRVTRLNGDQFALNPDLVERIEAHPDTVASLVDGTRYVVRETVEEVLQRIREYRAGVLAISYAMDRGSYRTAAPGPRPGDSSVVPFPIREER